MGKNSASRPSSLQEASNQVRAEFNELMRIHGLPKLRDDEDELVGRDHYDSLLMIEFAFRLEKSLGLTLDWSKFEPQQFSRVTQIAKNWLSEPLK
jgi:hypothetical protein